jgi:prepilin-type N-terminal cleavage/methylation domain-containing protein
MRKLVRTVRNAFRYGEAGFTLIELLVVIGILAALAGVVTLGVTRFIGRGAQEANCTDLHNVQTAAAACRVEVAAGNDTTDCTSQAAMVTAGYLLTTPKCTYTIDAEGRVLTQTCDGGDECPGVAQPGP